MIDAIDRFFFVRVFDDGAERTSNSQEFNAEYLPDILDKFAQFLRDSGFTYIDGVNAWCDESETVWSSDEVE